MADFKPISVKELLKRQSYNGLWPQFGVAEKIVTFSNATGKGAVGTVAVATVTGHVEMAVIAVCSTNMAGTSATIELGTSATTAGLIAQTTATNLIANEIWHDATPDASVELSTVILRKIVSDDVIVTVASAAATGGVVKFVILWSPISGDGNVTIA